MLETQFRENTPKWPRQSDLTTPGGSRHATMKFIKPHHSVYPLSFTRVIVFTIATIIKLHDSQGGICIWGRTARHLYRDSEIWVKFVRCL